MQLNSKDPSAMAGLARLWLPAIVLFLAIVPSAADAQTARKPNILLIAIDDLNDWVGFLKGHPQVQTPHMDRLAQRGMVFANAQCAAPLCCPSRAAIFSGQQPFRTGIYHNGPNIRQYHPELVLLPQYLAQHGYRTYGTGKLLHHKTPDILDESFTPEQRWSPLKNTAEAAFTKEELASKPYHPRHVVRYGRKNQEAVLPLNKMPSDRNPTGPAGESFDWGPFDVADDEMGDGQITNWAIERLQQEKDQPFFLGVGYYRPHIPLWAPQRYFDLYRNENIQLPKILETDLDDLSSTGRSWALEAVTAGSHQRVVWQNQWQAAVTAYLACISFVDAQIGRLFEALENSPHKDNTIIVLWGDHGWHLGEKQHWGKWTGWERATRVPLVVAPARVQSDSFKAAARCDEPVSLIDIYPTLVELCGLPAKSELDGQSLAPQLKNPALKTRPIVTTFDRGNYTVRTDRWRFIRYEGGGEELYDHAADPNEWHNLASQPAHAPTLAELRKLLPVTAAPRLGPAGKGDGG
jgi:arylsulfatase A-like enzyme